MIARTATAVLTALVLGAPALGLAASGAAEAAEQPMCEGQRATIIAVSGEATYGTGGNDVIYGERDVYIDGAGGDDVICLIDGAAYGEGGRDTIRVIGTPDPERLELSGEDLRVATGGGGDEVRILDSFGGTGTIDLGSTAGAEPNRIFFRTLSTVDVDLRKRTVSLNGSDYSLRGRIGEVEVASRSVTMTGTKRDDVLSVVQGTCRATLRGGKGADTLRVVPDVEDDVPFDCRRPSGLRAFGQKGRDTLIGGTRADRLIGGPGRDTADGGPGRDTCEAEKRRSCRPR